eukprot:1376112-Pyramimonas_sp.AAC.1
MNAENGAKQAVNKATGATMSVEEARQILGVDPNATPEQVLQEIVRTMKPNNDRPSSGVGRVKDRSRVHVYRAMETMEPDIAENARLDYIAKKTSEHQARMEKGQKPEDDQQTKEQ